MIRKNLQRLILLLSLSLICLLMPLQMVTAQEATSLPLTPLATVTEVEAVTTEEITVTDEPAPVVEVNITSEETPAAPTSDKDWLNIRQIVELLIGGAVILMAIFRGGDILTGMGKLVSLVTGNKTITDGATLQFLNLPPAIRAGVEVFINVVDPLTSTTINTVDDDIVRWFRKVTTPTVASTQVKDDTAGVG